MGSRLLCVPSWRGAGADVNAANDRNQTALTLAETPLPVTGTNGRRATQSEISTFLRSLDAED
ncbi:MAG TPA: hypothetical protein DIU48_12590 [Acidobacteria bacterium]|nr:hypothetical protein [Acidobacteriota bacterium]